MNFFKKCYCRLFQTGFRLMLPFMPYREPKILDTNDDVAKLFQDNKIERVLLVTDEGISKLGLTKELEQKLQKNNIKCNVYDKTVPNPTIDNIEEALEQYKKGSCQAIIAFGGGSSMDCAKMVGARVANPKKSVEQMKGLLKVHGKMPLLVAVPTTAGTGSETTLAAVITNAQTKDKYAINSFPLIPKYALLDEGLTLKLPPHITSTTGMDALTHAVEAYIGRSTTPKTRKCALEATKLIFENLEIVYKDGQNKVARKNMLKAAYLAGVAFTKSYVGYVHAIAHSLGGEYGVPHGLANAVVLPYVLKAYGKSAKKKLKKMAVYVGLADKATNASEAAKIFIEKIEQMNKNMNIPNKIPEVKEEDIPRLSKHAAKESNPLYPVPKEMDEKELAEIYKQISK
ncbi:MAG: iron-containing alcohol dehydrogenase [Clostridia bacterium]|nr:iron-containing alcohol dehydrogenase [Clostridia bacterium]